MLTTSGKGYSLDIREVLNMLKKPLLILPADTPFLRAKVIEEFIETAKKFDKAIITLIVDKECFPKKLASKVRVPIGIALFKHNGLDWMNVTMCEFPELLDIDIPKDLKYARRLCHEVSWRQLLG